ncbi:hypothetical protein SBA5_780022 [Candidatus Sulfotelmatomonas gaucii]|uniref:Uncharacterized protein n=1 Tax=Candidatus Sulfuritelmatomonas gaucii TaxID=2043161 RepID=A0A2N9M494_9BACT|nr:hypothetical protein SBA5_780022 [Candidatus Sulfotelmatomonas gaucii]
MPRTSSSRMIKYSSPSILISVPEYLPKSTRSPAFTSRGNTFPSSFDLPLPTEMTSPSWGFSFALSGMMIPPRMVSVSSIRRTRMRSCSGVNLVATDVAVAAIASLLLITRAEANPGTRVLVIGKDNRFGRLRSACRRRCRRSWLKPQPARSSTLAFQLLKISNEIWFVKGVLVEILSVFHSYCMTIRSLSLVLSLLPAPRTGVPKGI